MLEWGTGVRLAVLGGAVLSALLTSPASAADAVHGKALFAACIACHSETADAQGPSLKGVAGRAAGSLEDFRYSNAMKRAGFTWDAASLRDYLHDRDITVAGRPLPEGHPVAAGRNGTASRGQ